MIATESTLGPYIALSILWGLSLGEDFHGKSTPGLSMGFSLPSLVHKQGAPGRKHCDLRETA
jgi:hypothetical protein